MVEAGEIKILSKYAEYFQELKAKNIMNRTVIVLKETDTMNEAKEIMRRKKISGIPIVDDTNCLINIVTMEDLIKALESGEISKKIKELGRKAVLSLHENDDFERIVEYITAYPFGRYPVVDSSRKVVGIITKKDLLLGVVSKLSSLYLHDERTRDVLDSPLSILVQNQIDKNKPNFLYFIDGRDINTVGEGAALLKTFLNQKAIDEKLIRKICISTYEAEVNVVIHGQGNGRIAVNMTEDSIIVFVEDNGPGIEDIENAMRPGFSTATDYIRSLGFGAGMGLPNIKRFTDKLIITSEKNQGVKVEMLFWLKQD
ncbi:MAG: serine/threonine protein kinase [Syntrophus sp. (in: bacteria)]|nr:serine/threonine protein kinase [Syntrophus sp. (in: bacteria)]